MYRAVYWHRDVRISTALVKKSLFLALSRGELQGSDLYGLTDYDFSTKIKSLSPDLVSLIESSEHPHSYLCALEKDYDDNNKLHERLQSLEERIEFESLLADKLQKAGIPFTREEVIIDIPEKISFEVNLPVKNGGEYRPFTSTETLFSKGAVENLTGVLRKVRLFLPREKAESKLEEIVKITQIQL
jgi:HD superfamily phosphohydrolase